MKNFRILTILLPLAFVSLVIFKNLSENKWICRDGSWIRTGITLQSKPESGCVKEKSVSEDNNTSTFKVYFAKKNNETESLNCKSATFVERIVPFTILPAKESMDELLKGPSDEEKLNGIYTNINEGVILNSISFEGDKAEVDFDAKLDKNVGGSCKVSFIRSQIENTLMQFPNIKRVIISVNGRTEDILQP